MNRFNNKKTWKKNVCTDFSTAYCACRSYFKLLKQNQGLLDWFILSTLVM